MHRDRNNGTWPELKAKRHNKFDDVPLESVDEVDIHLYGEIPDSQKIKNDRAAKQLSQVQNMFKGMTDYDDKQKHVSKLMKANHENYE